MPMPPLSKATPMLTRRRLIALSAAFAATPALADTVQSWQGIGLGASVSVRLVGGSTAQARHTFRRIEIELARIEAMASLYRDSDLTRLNRDGHLAHPPADLLALLGLADTVHHATGGVFDPTVQPLYLALSAGLDADAARRLIGWQRVQRTDEAIRLDHGQALTLNGIAQGWAADRMADILRQEGFENALVDMGEVQALGKRADGGPWQAQITAPKGTALGQVALTNRALATSSPMGTLIGSGLPHILGPQGQPPHWSTVSVSAESAALADALSTAFCLMPLDLIRQSLTAFPQARLEALA